MSKNDDWKEVAEKLSDDPKKIEWLADLGRKLYEREIKNECMAFNLQIASNLMTDGMDVEIMNEKEYSQLYNKVLSVPLIIEVPVTLLDKERKHISNVVASVINKELKTASKIYIYDLCSNLILYDNFNNKVSLTVIYGLSSICIDETEPEIEAINEYLVLRNEYHLNAEEIKQLSKSQRIYLLNKYTKNNVKLING